MMSRDDLYHRNNDDLDYVDNTQESEDDSRVYYCQRMIPNGNFDRRFSHGEMPTTVEGKDGPYTYHHYNSSRYENSRYKNNESAYHGGRIRRSEDDSRSYPRRKEMLLSNSSSDRFHYDEMRTVVLDEENETYTYHNYRTRYNNSFNNNNKAAIVNESNRHDREEDLYGIGNDFRRNDVFRSESGDDSQNRQPTSNYYYKESNRYNKPQYLDSKFIQQCRISDENATSSTLYDYASSSSSFFLDNKVRIRNKDHGNVYYQRCQHYAPKTEDFSRNNETSDEFHYYYNQDYGNYWDNKESPAIKRKKEGRARIKIIDNDNGNNSDFDPKVPASRSSEQANKPAVATPVSDSMNRIFEGSSFYQGKTIEVSPGCILRLRGADETWNAILNDYYRPHQCVCCNEDTVFCIQDADYFLCPTCKVVNPTLLSEEEELNKGGKGGGVGLGFLVEDLINWQNMIAKERNMLSK